MKSWWYGKKYRNGIAAKTHGISLLFWGVVAAVAVGLVLGLIEPSGIAVILAIVVGLVFMLFAIRDFAAGRRLRLDRPSRRTTTPGLPA